MEKRDLIDRIFIGICALTLLSVFLPCDELDKIKGGITTPSYNSILDGKIGFVYLVFPIAVFFLIVLGKRVIASVIGIITAIVNACTIYFFWDASEYAVNVFKTGSRLADFYNMMGYDGCVHVYPVGFYIAIAAVVLMVLISIVNLVIKD